MVSEVGRCGEKDIGSLKIALEIGVILVHGRTVHLHLNQPTRAGAAASPRIHGSFGRNCLSQYDSKTLLRRGSLKQVIGLDKQLPDATRTVAIGR